MVRALGVGMFAGLDWIFGSLGWEGGGCLDWHCLNCDLGGFGGWVVISLAAMLGAWGGSVVWTGGLSEL